MPKYIDEQEFCDFKKNFHTLIETFNHSITDLKKNTKKTADEVGKLNVIVAEIRGSLKVTSKIVWWILGIVGVVVGAAVLANIAG